MAHFSLSVFVIAKYQSWRMLGHMHFMHLAESGNDDQVTHGDTPGRRAAGPPGR
jgi:hypothetical protein